MSNGGPSDILRIMSLFMQSKILLVANKIGIFSTIGHNELTADELAVQLNFDKKHSRLMLNALAAMKIVEKNNGKYKNSTAVREFLLEESANYIGSLLLFQENEWESWDYLYDTLIEKQPKGADLEAGMDEEELVVYMKAMHDIGKMPAGLLPALVRLKGTETLLDLGCGSCVYSLGFLKRYPGLSVTLLDMPEVLKITRTNIPEKYSNNVRFIEANYFEWDYSGKFDCVLCSHNLHYNDEEMNIQLLGKIYSILNEGGTLILHDYFIDEDTLSPFFPVLFSVNMMMQTKGGECYDINTVKHWITKDNSYTNYKHISLGTELPGSIVIAQK
jgi:SAM-dependent methyltransferase